MLRIVRKSKEDQLWERLLAERERLVQVLAEQVEYLRAQLQMPTATVSMAAATPKPFTFDTADLPDEVQLSAINAISDEEEELQAMLQAQVISQQEFDEAMERLKRRDPSDIIE